MKMIKRAIITTSVFVLVFLVAGITLYANAGEVVETLEESTWLARQLEIYGVPAGISAGIGTVIGFLGYYLISRGSRKTLGVVSSLFSGSTDKLDIANQNATALLDQVKNLKTDLETQLKKLIEENANLKDQILELAESSKKALHEVLAVKNELSKGASKIINSLVKGEEDEKDKKEIPKTTSI